MSADIPGCPRCGAPMVHDNPRRTRWACGSFHDSLPDEPDTRVTGAFVEHGNCRARQQLNLSLKHIANAVDILDGNAEPVDPLDQEQPELLRKLSEHMEAYHSLVDDRHRLERLERACRELLAASGFNMANGYYKVPVSHIDKLSGLLAEEEER